jgi:poly(hydroxyalkanoate) granule-associated protein
MKEAMTEMQDRVARAFDYDRVKNEMMHAGKNAWFAGLGAIATIETEATTMFDKLVEKGKNFDKREKSFLGEAADEMIDGVKSVGKKIETGAKKRVVETLHRVGMPSNEEIQTLIAKVDDLSKRVQSMKAVK